MAGVIGGALKFAIGRMRPVFLETLGQTGFYPFTNEWAFNSMPSGHAVASFAGLVMIGLLNPKWKWLTWTLAIVIGVSRIAIGDHFPSDVFVGRVYRNGMRRLCSQPFALMAMDLPLMAVCDIIPVYLRIKYETALFRFCCNPWG